MSVLSLISGLVSFAASLIKYLEQQKLIDAGAAIEANKGLSAALEAVRDAQKLRANLDDAERERLRRKYDRGA